MSFQISKTAQKWFKGVETQAPFNKTTSMDIYYICFLVGINSGKEPREPEDGRTFLAAGVGWPTSYTESMYTIIAMFLDSEVDRFAINRDDKEDVKNHLSKYIAPSTPTLLTPHAIKIMDSISYAGFLEIHDELEAPTQVNVLISEYTKLLNKYIS